MGNLKVGHIVEAALWLLLAVFLYAYSFEFDKEIEIYKFGASAWPRAILLLISIAAIGQLAYHWKVGDGDESGVLSAASDDGAEEMAESTHHTSLKWYLSTFFLLSLPFAYMLLPQWIHSWLSLEKEALHTIKLVCAAVLLLIYVYGLRRNLVGGMLALPIFFGALLQDMGFYSVAPLFIVGVMFLMGERRPGWMAIITVAIYSLLLMLFVSLLYVGLPTGNISPFYEIGTGMVNLLQ